MVLLVSLLASNLSAAEEDLPENGDSLRTELFESVKGISRKSAANARSSPQNPEGTKNREKPRWKPAEFEQSVKENSGRARPVRNEKSHRRYRDDRDYETDVRDNKEEREEMRVADGRRPPRFEDGEEHERRRCFRCQRNRYEEPRWRDPDDENYDEHGEDDEFYEGRRGYRRRPPPPSPPPPPPPPPPSPFHPLPRRSTRRPNPFLNLYLLNL